MLSVRMENSGSCGSTSYTVAWKRCTVCTENLKFKSPREFCRHLRDFHCTKEGGSFVCRYGFNNVCPSLPVEGVSDRDYEDHVARDHVAGDGSGGVKQRKPSHSDTDSVPSTPSNTEPNIVQDQHKWTVYNSKVNLPAVLNDPRLVRRETDFFTKTWGESFENVEVMPSPRLPEITKDHFRRYLKKNASRYKAHVELNKVEVPNDQPSEFSDIPSLQSRLQERSGIDLESIPKVFLHSSFNLENPDTFMTVFPWTKDSQPNSGPSKQSSKLVQEKLSHHLDLVEMQIAKQIALRSKAFFQAMSSHDTLLVNLKNTYGSIKYLRDKVNTLDHVLVDGPLKVMRASRIKTNELSVINKLKLMATVHQTQPTIQVLLSTNDFLGALDLISTTQDVLRQELQGIVCFRHLGSQLSEMEKLIEKMMQEDFVRYANQDLNRPPSEMDRVWQESGTVKLIDLTPAQERLMAIVLGMLRQKKYNFIDVYRQEAFTALKATIKQAVIDAVVEAENVDTETESKLADQMRLLDYKQWMLMLKDAFSRLLIIIRRVKGVHDVMQEVLQEAAGEEAISPVSSVQTSDDEDVISTEHNPGTNGIRSDNNVRPKSPKSRVSRISVSEDVDMQISRAEDVKLSTALRDMLWCVCDHAHDRCVKLLTARAKDGFLERLNLTEFVELSRTIEDFVQQCHDVCGRRSTTLRTCLQSQANKFVNRFHEERKTKLSLILDNERWKQADVPAEFQELVDHISESNSLCLPDKRHDQDKRPTEYLLVNGDRYAVVGTVLMLLKMVIEYCQCVDDIPTATPDILTRLIELLKMFNSRSCQLILGAGAVQVVGLKTISTKNIALASRCLQLVVLYIPRVRHHFEKRLQGKQLNMVKHFEQISKDYKDHIDELYNKLVHIMESTFDMYLSKWEVKAPMPSLCFRNICKQISKLYEALSDTLPPKSILQLFQRVHRSFVKCLRNQLVRLNVSNDGGPQHGLVVADVAFYQGSMKSISGLSQLNTNMDEIWRQR